MREEVSSTGKICHATGVLDEYCEYSLRTVTCSLGGCCRLLKLMLAYSKRMQSTECQKAKFPDNTGRQGVRLETCFTISRFYDSTMQSMAWQATRDGTSELVDCHCASMLAEPPVTPPCDCVHLYHPAFYSSRVLQSRSWRGATLTQINMNGWLMFLLQSTLLRVWQFFAEASLSEKLRPGR